MHRAEPPSPYLMSLQRVLQERDALREEDGLERDRILHELMEEQQTRVRRKREELRALKRESCSF